MRFKALPVTSLEDVTVDLEQLTTRSILDQSSTSVLQLAVTGTQRKLNGGTGTLTFTASATSGVVTISHQLGTTPMLVVVSCQNVGTLLAAFYGTLTSTTFPVVGIAASAITASVPFSWLAIG